MGTFLSSESLVYFTTREIHGFSHQFLRARENAAKSTLRALRSFSHSMIVSTFSAVLLVPKSDDSLKERTEKSFGLRNELNLFLKEK